MWFVARPCKLIAFAPIFLQHFRRPLSDVTRIECLEIAKEREDTLVLVTSDHEVGGLLIEPANPIDNSLDDVKFSFNTAVGSGTHTGVPVPVYAFGPGSENFTGTLDNTDIYYAMLAALDLDDKEGTCLRR